MSHTSNLGVGGQDPGHSQNPSPLPQPPDAQSYVRRFSGKKNPDASVDACEKFQSYYQFKFPDMPPWTKLRTKEPLSSNLRARVREDLIIAHHLREEHDYCSHLKCKWCYGMEIKSSSGQPELLSSPVGCPGVWDLLNRLTSFYWMPSAAEEGRMLPSILILGCILEEWFRCHNNKPYTEYKNCFANLVRIFPSGPATVKGIIELHKLFLNQAASIRERINSGEHIVGGHDSFEQPQNYHFRPTIRAIIIILDQYHKPTRKPTRAPPSLDRRSKKGFFDLCDHSKKQTVLLVRTGDDSHLKSPITFEMLKINNLCLPLDRTDVAAGSNDVVRVSIATAVEFISDLERREDTLYPERSRALVDKEHRANAWVDDELKEADEKGIDNVESTWLAVRRAQNPRMGEIFPELKRQPFGLFIRQDHC